MWQSWEINLAANFKATYKLNEKRNRLEISKRLSSLGMSRGDREMIWKELNCWNQSNKCPYQDSENY